MWAWGTCHSQENSIFKKIGILPYFCLLQAMCLFLLLLCYLTYNVAMLQFVHWSEILLKGGCNVSHLMNGWYTTSNLTVKQIFERWYQMWHVDFQRQCPQKSLCAFWLWTRAFDSLEEAGSSQMTFQKHVCCAC